MQKVNVTACLFPVEKAAIVAMAKTSFLSESSIAQLLIRLGIDAIKDKTTKELQILYIEKNSEVAAEQCLVDCEGTSKYVYKTLETNHETGNRIS